jgi:shikimate kinase
MMKIILIGYRCTGKTSVGKKIAEHLGIPFYDTDDLIQRHANKTIREIVEKEGWDAFRAEEKATIKKLSSLTEVVIAAGGGAIMDAENRKTLKRNGMCIWLTADVRTIVARMRNDRASTAQRPPLSDSDVEQETARILKTREPVYQESADCIVDTEGKEIDAVVDEICSALASRNRNNEVQKSQATS